MESWENGRENLLAVIGRIYDSIGEKIQAGE